MQTPFVLPLEEQSMLSTLLTQPHRKYHNINHINDCLAEAYKMFNVNVGNQYGWHLTYAIWYHDAIYNPYTPPGANESMSAELLREYHIKNDNISKHVIDEVRDAILRTAMHTQDQMSTLQTSLFPKLMLDIDLSGFGKDRMVFAQNGMNIRHEYYNTKIADFLGGRLNFYKQLIRRPTLYYTEYFHDLYHVKSQENIKWEMSVLEDAIQNNLNIWGDEMMLALDGY